MNKIKTLVLIMAMMATMATWSAPALRGQWQVRQKDGTMLTIEQRGDEHQHWMQTADGVLLVERDGGYYVAEIDEQGQLAPTLLLAHNPALRNIGECEAANRQTARRAMFHERGASARRASKINDNGGYLQHIGSPKILVVLAEYPDLQFTVNDPVAAFEQFLNGTEQQDLGNHNKDNVNSIRQYFSISSHGKFTPQFDVKGPVTLPRNMKYYGGGSSSSERMSALGKDAIEMVKDSVNLRDYDNDGDGNVELVYVIHAGYGQNQGGPDSAMWAKVSAVRAAIGDTLHVTRLGCNAELFHPQRPGYINGTGVFCHEFSHAMGLPDVYPTTTDARSVLNQNMEQWDVMDYGLYLANGFKPIPYTAWEQEAMGWIDIEPLTTSQKGIEILPAVEEDGKAYKILNPDNDREFIVMENFQKRGISSGIVNHGLLVYHVAYPYEKVNMTDNPNNTAGKPSVAAVPACGINISDYLISGAGYGGNYSRAEYNANQKAIPFPGTAGVTELTDEALLPNYKFYPATSGDPNIPIRCRLLNIKENEQTGAVSFDFIRITKGDVNGDVAIDVEDVVAVVNGILGEPADNFIPYAADINGDDTIDVDDVVAIVNMILEQNSSQTEPQEQQQEEQTEPQEQQQEEQTEPQEQQQEEQTEPQEQQQEEQTEPQEQQQENQGGNE